MKLFTAGPVSCRHEVLEEMSRQMFSHRSDEYKELQIDIVNRLQEFLETSNKIFLFPSSGSGAMEASVRNCVKEKMLSCINGAFGSRYAQVGESNDRKVLKLNSPLGEPTNPELLNDKLSDNQEIEAVTITHNETSVGLLNPLPELARVVKDNGKILLVDAVSSMGGTPIKVDKWGIDVCFASSQKCFGIPPGLAVISVSQEALNKSEKIKNKGWYFDLKLYEEFGEKKKGTHMTPSIPQILALRKRLKLIEEEGKDNHFNKYVERNEKIIKGIKKLGLSPFPKEGFESPTISCIKSPVNMNGLKIYEEMRRRGFELAKGYGEIREKTFRIGNMGHILLEDIDEMLEALEEVIS